MVESDLLEGESLEVTNRTGKKFDHSNCAVCGTYYKSLTTDNEVLICPYFNLAWHHQAVELKSIIDLFPESSVASLLKKNRTTIRNKHICIF